MHNNNFHLLRLGFATLVVFSHSYALLGIEEPTLWGRTLGNLAVHGFFAISGYLICQSFIRSRTLSSFLLKRILRIVPGLLVALLVTRLIAAWCEGFRNNPVPHIANGPVWTLPWEGVCYLGVAVIGLLGALRRSGYPALFVVVWSAYLVDLADTSAPYLVIAPLVLMFSTGTFIAVMEDAHDLRSLTWLSIAGLSITALHPVLQIAHGLIANHIPFLWGPAVSVEQVGRVIYLFSFPFVVVLAGKIGGLVTLKDDISYGIYIYGWPVAQAVIYYSQRLGLSLDPYSYFVITITIVVSIAYLSWKFVEKPSLGLKTLFTRASSGSGAHVVGAAVRPE